jgi:hypothetical protein
VKIRRGPKSTNNWTTTDTKTPAEYAQSWWPGRPIRFDGTIDKSGERHTDLGVEIYEEDVIALHKVLLSHYRGYMKERDKLLGTVLELESAFMKISHLLSWHKSRAPDQDNLLAAIEEIVDHFGRSWNRSKPYKSRFAWLKWRTL